MEGNGWPSFSITKAISPTNAKLFSDASPQGLKMHDGTSVSMDDSLVELVSDVSISK